MPKIMRTFVVTFYLLFTLGLFGQDQAFAVFQSENFLNASGDVIVKKDTFKLNGLVDLDFYRKNFYIPYYYPKRFVHSRYKNQLVTVWKDSSAKKDYSTNWTYSFTYDEKSRVIAYSYSGCIICSQMPFIVSISYDDQDRPIKLEMRTNDGKPVDQVKSEPHEKFFLTYDSKGNISALEHFDHGILSQRIAKM